MKFKIVKVVTVNRDYSHTFILWYRRFFVWYYLDCEIVRSDGNMTEVQLIEKLIKAARDYESKDADKVLSTFTVKNGEVV